MEMRKKEEEKYREKEKEMFRAYLIFVIFFTQAKFLENKIYTEKRVNYDKLHSKLPIFRLKSVKIYTRQFFFTQTLSVVSVTNMRYVEGSSHAHEQKWGLQFETFPRILRFECKIDSF